jgi:transposase
MWFDEFSLSTIPTIYYGWAPVNTRPEVSSNERRRERVNGFLSIDGVTGKEYFQSSPSAKTPAVAHYLADLIADTMKEGYTRLTFVLDNNPTHKKKMRTLLEEELSKRNLQKNISLSFIYTPPYSPKLNLAEYLIHILRQRLLHHHRYNTTLTDLIQRVVDFLACDSLQTPQQIAATLRHIIKLGMGAM